MQDAAEFLHFLNISGVIIIVVIFNQCRELIEVRKEVQVSAKELLYYF